MCIRDRVYNALPYRKNQKIYLPVFAAEISGNPHAFDMGTTEGNILYQVILISLEQRGLVVDVYKRQMFPCLSIIKVRKNETLSHSEGEYRKSAGIR